MHLLVDALAADTGSSAITLENLLQGWTELETDDQITILTGPDGPAFRSPAEARIDRLPRRLPGLAGGLWQRSVATRSAARRHRADAFLSGLTASAFLGTASPRAVLLYDLRHELRPEQFERSRRWARRLSYGLSMRTADAVCCISRRTRDDLVRRHPWARGRAVVSRYGADHVDRWPAKRPGQPRYALAFGHFANKNVDAVLDAWAQFSARDQTMTLRLVGMGRTDRAAAERRVAALGIVDRVELMPWLDDQEFQQCFVDASLILFPSDFEGFGLPAIEALRLEIPLVVSSDPALAEVTGGHASTAADVRPATLAAAIERALALTPEQLRAGRGHSDQFTWRLMAQQIRDALTTT